MIRREIYTKLLKALSRQAVTALIGPRQVGKTTLAIAIAADIPSVYLDLELSTDRSMLNDPILFFNQNQDKLIILDEIHKMPGIFQTLRGVVDQRRRQGLRNGQFLILGSASIDLLNQSSETLAGRIEFIDMAPLNLMEINDEQEQIYPKKLWLRGGFPDNYLATNDEDSYSYRSNFIRTYLEKEIPEFGPRISSNALERLWTMLAHNQGQLLNASTLANNLSTSTTTIANYIDLLSDLLLVRRLLPLHKNIQKRLVKSPRIYIRDSGVAHALLGIATYNQLTGHPVCGASWEGFVIENILSITPNRTRASFYRTIAGAEIDLILEFLDGSVWAIEIKSGLTPNIGKGFYNAIEDINPTKAFVVYAGTTNYPLTSSIQVISLIELMQNIKQHYPL